MVAFLLKMLKFDLKYVKIGQLVQSYQEKCQIEPKLVIFLLKTGNILFKPGYFLFKPIYLLVKNNHFYSNGSFLTKNCPILSQT